MKPAPDNLVIRRAVAADAEAIHAGIVRIAEHLDEKDKITSTPEDLRLYGFGPNPAFSVLIAEIDGIFAGMSLYFRSFSTWRGVPGAYIQDFVVDPAFRGKRIGEALLRQTAKNVRAGGGAYLRLAVDADNHSAQGFYEAMGLGWSRNERIHAAYGAAFEALAAGDENQP